jgi:transcriptional regulator with XRE-family HTH domain
MASNTEEVQKRFGKRIQQQRAKLAISQEELAFRTNLDRTYISGIERGVRNPSLKNIAKIADALELSLADLFSF